MKAVVSVDEINEYLSAQGDFMSSGPIVVERADPDDVLVRWTYDDSKTRPGGYIAGPTLFTIADLAGWVLVFATEGILPMAVTWDLHITFMRPAIGRDVVARAKQLKRGRSLIYGDVTMYVDGAPDKPVAHATVTYALPNDSNVSSAP
ncbi:MAG: PaaI family thioesterase [Acidimicrobiales bacterium]